MHDFVTVAEADAIGSGRECGKLESARPSLKAAATARHPLTAAVRDAGPVFQTHYFPREVGDLKFYLKSSRFEMWNTSFSSDI